jgi:hypothetical protein
VICPSWIRRPRSAWPSSTTCGILVEGDFDDGGIAHEDTKEEGGGGVLARDRHHLVHDGLGVHGLLGDEDGTIALAHRGAGIHHPVLLVHQDVGSRGHRRHVELAGPCPPVQGLDVFQHVLDLDPRRLHLSGGERVEHEGVVGIGAVADTDEGHDGA